MTHVDLRLYGIIDPNVARGRSLADMALAAVAGGATLIQYRDKTTETREMIARARSIANALTGTKVPLLVNDRVDVVLAAGADGVHIGQEDMHPADARAILGTAAIIGLTVKNQAHAAEAQRLPIDYACVGGVFPTGSKDNPDAPVGLQGFAALLLQIRQHRPHLPVGAIAGIGLDNAASVIAAGSDGIAVISALFAPDDIALTARRLRAAVDDALGQRRH